LLSILLFFVAFVGYAWLLTTMLNVVYGRPYRRVFLKITRLVVGLAILSGVPLFGLVYGWDAWTLFGEIYLVPFRPLPGGILIAFVYLGVIYFGINLYRMTAPHVDAVVSEKTTTRNIAEELGYRPVGDGKHKGVAGYKINQIFTVDFTELTLKLPNLPPGWDNLTILHLSDLHFYGTPSREYFKKVFEHVQMWGTPDILVISGDIIDDDQYLVWIEELLSPLKWKQAAFAILGNHDWWKDSEGVRDNLRKLNIQVLGNGWVRQEISGHPLIAIGHEGPWFRPAPDLSQLPDGFRLLISHTPDNIRFARKHRIPLMLSGHNHGGQIRLPIIGSIFVPSIYARKFDMGTFQQGPTLLHVNRGLSGKEPIRFHCNPQVTWITLKSNG